MPASFASLASRRLACTGSSSKARSSQQPPQVAPAPRSAAAARRLTTTTICASAAGGKNQVAVPGNASAPVTDDAVPEAHKGLHASLYGEGDAEDAHGSAAKGGSGGGDGPYRARPVRRHRFFLSFVFSFVPTMFSLSLFPCPRSPLPLSTLSTPSNPRATHLPTSLAKNELFRRRTTE